ncbi:MAG: hypothetical protein AAGB12_07480 [Pseudomonadota bacterium]
MKIEVIVKFLCLGLVLAINGCGGGGGGDSATPPAEPAPNPVDVDGTGSDDGSENEGEEFVCSFEFSDGNSELIKESRSLYLNGEANINELIEHADACINSAEE